MTPSYNQASSDNESLQADVMRFMAIIAFCLIAILALVKEVEPAPADKAAAPVKAAAPAAAAPNKKEPTPDIRSAPVETLAQTPPEPRWHSPIEKPAAEVGETQPSEKPMPEKPRLEVTAVSPQTRAETPAPTVEPEPEEDGLSLRFASHGDFLRLIARGDIRVYAFNDGGQVLGLNRSYEFLTARTPGQVYELMPQTIPSLISDSLTRSRADDGDSRSFSWGITLPQGIASQISGYLAAAQTGQLVIDRYGDVHHVAHN